MDNSYRSFGRQASRTLTRTNRPLRPGPSQIYTQCCQAPLCPISWPLGNHQQFLRILDQVVHRGAVVFPGIHLSLAASSDLYGMPKSIGDSCTCIFKLQHFAKTNSQISTTVNEVILKNYRLWSNHPAILATRNRGRSAPCAALVDPDNATQESLNAQVAGQTLTAP